VLVRFPDVPDAVTFGDTKEEALARATDALLTVFDAYMKDKRDIPPPSASRGLGVQVPALDASKVALYQTMGERRVNKTELAKRLDWHMPQVDRVLKVRHGSQLDQLEAAFAAVGKRLTLTITDREPAHVPRAMHREFQGHYRCSGSSGGRRTTGRCTGVEEAVTRRAAAGNGVIGTERDKPVKLSA